MDKIIYNITILCTFCRDPISVRVGDFVFIQCTDPGFLLRLVGPMHVRQNAIHTLTLTSMFSE